MSGRLNQLRLLLWKNFLLKRRQPGRPWQDWRPAQSCGGMPALVLLVISCAVVVSGSAGDRDPAYRMCRERCEADSCRRGDATGPPAWRRAMAWTCGDDCAHQCMHEVTRARVDGGEPVLQYHGKWPFYRLASVIQEPASVLFSLMNLAANVVGLRRFRASSSAREYPMFSLYHWHCAVSCSAWVCSAVFHSRDLLWTERLDYFSASGVVLFSAYCSLVRLALVRRPAARALAAVSLSLLFTAHVYYLSAVKFDYGYNMAANVCVAAVNMALWLLWCARSYPHQPYVWKCAAVLVCTAALMTLELGDFPPLWFAFDAHSLWHLGTAPLPLLWYSFLADDALFLASSERKAR